MKDRTIICVACEASFLFKVADQERFDTFGFDPPRRCPECRARKNRHAEPQKKWKDKGRKRRERSYRNNDDGEW